MNEPAKDLMPSRALLQPGVITHHETGVEYLKTVDLCPFAVYEVARQMKERGEWGAELPALTCRGVDGTKQVVAGLTSVVAACIAGVRISECDVRAYAGGADVSSHFKGVDYLDTDAMEQAAKSAGKDVWQVYVLTASVEDMHHVNASNSVAAVVTHNQEMQGMIGRQDRGFDMELWAMITGEQSNLFCVWDFRLPEGKVLFEFPEAKAADLYDNGSSQGKPSGTVFQYVGDDACKRFSRVEREVKREELSDRSFIVRVSGGEVKDATSWLQGGVADKLAEYSFAITHSKVMEYAGANWAGGRYHDMPDNVRSHRDKLLAGVGSFADVSMRELAHASKVANPSAKSEGKAVDQGFGL